MLLLVEMNCKYALYLFSPLLTCKLKFVWNMSIKGFIYYYLLLLLLLLLLSLSLSILLLLLVKVEHDLSVASNQ